MSLFNDMTAADLEDAEDIFGPVDFTIGAAHYQGIHNEYSADEQIEIGGDYVSVNATLVCRLPQFRTVPKPLHKTFAGKEVALDGLRYLITHIAADSISITFGLTIQA